MYVLFNWLNSKSEFAKRARSTENTSRANRSAIRFIVDDLVNTALAQLFCFRISRLLFHIENTKHWPLIPQLFYSPTIGLSLIAPDPLTVRWRRRESRHRASNLACLTMRRKRNVQIVLAKEKRRRGSRGSKTIPIKATAANDGLCGKGDNVKEERTEKIMRTEAATAAVTKSRSERIGRRGGRCLVVFLISSTGKFLGFPIQFCWENLPLKPGLKHYAAMKSFTMRRKKLKQSE